MSDDKGITKLRWNSSYSAMTIAEASERLGFNLWKLGGVTVKTLLGSAYKAGERENTKRRYSYDHLVEYLEIEG